MLLEAAFNLLGVLAGLNRVLPDLELPLRRPPGTHAQPWSLEVGVLDHDVGD
jgi:hypothetical protein